MKKEYEKVHRENFTNHIKADVIILGCSLPGIVAAHNLKKKFGDTMDVVVLEVGGGVKSTVRKTGVSVAFQDLPDDDSSDEENKQEPSGQKEEEKKDNRKEPTSVYDSVAYFFREKYSADFNIPLPDYLEPQKPKSSLSKLYQDINGSKFPCKKNYNEFDYLGSLERFELLQYQTLLDCSMQNLFQPFASKTEAEKQRMYLLDQMTMETHMSNSLYSTTSKHIMRMIVELVCGVSADNISVLFYLHQCFRVSSSRNIIDGDNTRIREKLLGHFRRRLSHKLQLSVADITVTTKPIKEIRTSPDEEVILEPEKGETDYICKLLAMAIRPDQMRNIVIETKLVTENEINVISAMQRGVSKKFIIEYQQNFWQPLGSSGDILSVRGPIVWAMERPTLTTTGSADKYVALTGYLKVGRNIPDSKDEVVEQLVNLFGQRAANPVTYTEFSVNEIWFPRLEEYMILRKLTTETSTKYVEWAALDMYADNDMISALEAGHAAYVHLLRVLRPQAVTYDDLACGLPPNHLYDSFDVMGASVNVFSSTRILLICVAIVAAVTLIRRLRQ